MDREKESVRKSRREERVEERGRGENDKIRRKKETEDKAGGQRKWAMQRRTR